MDHPNTTESFVFVKADVDVYGDGEDAETSRSPSASRSPPASYISTPAPVSLLAIKTSCGGGGKRGVGRLVDSTQADDRRMIHLVRDRPLLYARSNLPVASYQAQVKKLWREVADIMGWTVADVRRKWSHIRNSYSRHLRNEIHGVRTGKGRQVSKWYLADELEFLREHMATDTRASPMTPYSLTPYSNPFLKLEMDQTPESEPPATVPLTAPSTAPSPAPWYAMPDGAGASEDSEPDESEAYFQFFRGIYKDYRRLAARQQRAFRRQCLIYLHELVDAAEAPADPAPSQPVNLSSRDTDLDLDPDSCPD